MHVPRLSALSEIITNNENGFLFETNDSTILSNKLSDLLTDRTLRLKILRARGVAGREIVIKKYTWEKAAKDLKNFLLSLQTTHARSM